MTSKYLTVPEAAERLRISEDHLYRLIAEKQIRHTRVGKKILLTEEHLEAFMKAREVSVRVVNPLLKQIRN